MAYNDLLTKAFLQKEYLNKKRSLPKLQAWLHDQGYKIHYNTLLRYVRKYGLLRSLSETRKINEKSPNKNLRLTESQIEAIDGFLLGDGHIDLNRNNVKEARVTCSTKYREFCSYLLNPFKKFGVNIGPYLRKSDNRTYWQGKSRMHPEFYEQWKRWYSNSQKIYLLISG